MLHQFCRKYNSLGATRILVVESRDFGINLSSRPFSYLHIGNTIYIEAYSSEYIVEVSRIWLLKSQQSLCEQNAKRKDYIYSNLV